jgi:hypothetical protein
MIRKYSIYWYRNLSMYEDEGTERPEKDDCSLPIIDEWLILLVFNPASKSAWTGHTSVVKSNKVK